MRTSWKAAVVPAAIILLLLFSIAGPIIIAAQAANARPFANATGPFILKATRIDATNAHLALTPSIAHPTFTFATAAIQGLQILAPGPTGYTLKITASSLSNATNVAIITAFGDDYATAVASFVNKADLITLALGGTVSQLAMVNVSLTIDTSLSNGTLTLGQPLITLVSGSPNATAASAISPSAIINSMKATATATVLAATPTVAVTTTATVTATSTSVSSATPTVKATSSSTTSSKTSSTPTAAATSSSSTKSSKTSSSTPTAAATSSSSSSSSSSTSSSATPTATSTSSCGVLCTLKKIF